jgi:hypothetical protein
MEQAAAGGPIFVSAVTTLASDTVVASLQSHP